MWSVGHPTDQKARKSNMNTRVFDTNQGFQRANKTDIQLE
jgi:hypothetical protein